MERGIRAMKKRVVAIILALVMCVVIFPATTPDGNAVGNDLPFTDVPANAWFYEYVHYAHENGLMLGTSSARFSPNAPLTRAMVATILYRMEGEPNVTFRNVFSDVHSGRWYSDAIIWAFDNGIVTGVGSNRFAPNDNITREQFATMLYRYALYKGVDVTVPPDFNLVGFTDVGDISEWASDAMYWANYNELIRGRNATTLAPRAPISRAECAAILQRFRIMDIAEFNLTVSNREFLVSNENDVVYFYAEVDGNPISVELFENNNKVAEMRDDGLFSISGDDIENDGVFSARVEIDLSIESTLNFRAVANIDGENIISNRVSILVIAPFTQQELEDMETVRNALSNIRMSDTYLQLAPHQRAEVIIDKLTEFVAQGLVKDGSIRFNENENLVIFRHSSGVLAGEKVVELSREVRGSEERLIGTDIGMADRNVSTIDDDTEIRGIASSSATISGATSNALILFALDFPSDHYSEYPWYVDLEAEWNSRGLQATRRMATIPNFRQMTNYDLIVIAAHEAHFDGVPFIKTNERVTTTNLQTYTLDLDAERIVAVGAPNRPDSVYIVFPQAIIDWYGNGELSGSIVIVETCQIMGHHNVNGGIVNNIYANAFISRGVEAFVSFYNNVCIFYARSFSRTIVNRLIAGTTARSGFNTAINIHGTNDGQPAPRTAVPHFRGNENATLIPTGIRNGSFEYGVFNIINPINPVRHWNTHSDVRTVMRLGDLNPTDGRRMAMLSTGIGANRDDYISNFLGGTQGSIMQQTFRVPSTARTLEFDYNMVSEEPPEWVGSRFNDGFITEILDQNGVVLERVVYTTVNNATWLPASGFRLTTGQQTGRVPWQTGWETVSVDLRAYRDEIITLRFLVFDRGDARLDSAVLLDNIVIN